MKAPKNPLFMPKGSVRAMLVLMLTGGVLIAAFRGIEVSRDIMLVWANIIGVYFGLRQIPAK